MLSHRYPTPSVDLYGGVYPSDEKAGTGIAEGTCHHRKQDVIMQVTLPPVTTVAISDNKTATDNNDDNR